MYVVAIVLIVAHPKIYINYEFDNMRYTGMQCKNRGIPLTTS